MDLFDQFNYIKFEDIVRGEYIDKGSSGKVYNGIYKDNKIIIKCFSIDNYNCEEYWKDDVYHELKIYNKLGNTKGSCKCIGFSYKDDIIYILLKDYDTKITLFDYLNNDKIWEKYNRILSDEDYYYKYKNNEWIFRLDRQIKISLTKQIIDIIYELHKKNIVHCDLKTGNIIYNENTDQLILIDFGASQNIKKYKDKDIDYNMGTMGYACIVLNEKGICSKKSDIYSLGVCIIEIWCGAIWKTGETHKKCRSEMLSSLRKLKDKEPLLENEIKKCINLNPKRRPYINTFRNNILKIL